MSRPDIEAVIGADPRPFNDAMAKILRESAQAGRGVERSFEGVAPALGRIATTVATRFAAASAAIGAVALAAKTVATEIASLDRAAARAGMSADRFQQTRFAAGAVGVQGADVDRSLEEFNLRIREASRETGEAESDLARLLEANNIRLKDRAGEIRSTNDLLGEAANLVANAASEADKITIVEALGLTREWIPLLERGADGLRQAQTEASAAGAVIDAELVAKAREFDAAWNAAVNSFSARTRAVLAELIPLFGQIVSLADKVGGYLQGVKARRDFEANGLDGASLDSVEVAIRRFRQEGKAVPPQFANRFEQLRGREQGDAGDDGLGLPRATEPLTIDVRRRRAGPGTIIPPRNAGGGGGGGGGAAGAESVSSLDRQLEQIEKRTALLRVEAQTFGQSAEAVSRARIEQELLSAAKKDGEEVTEAQTSAIKAAAAGFAEAEQRVRALKEAQSAANDTARFLGQSLSGFLSDVVSGGKNASEAIMNLTKRLGEAALQAVLLGDGPLAKLFGTANPSGGVGGLFGAIFGGFSRGGGIGSFATGQQFGPFLPALSVGTSRVPRDMLAQIHEGEIVIPKYDADLIRNGGLGGAGAYAPVYNIDARGADAAAVARLERSLAERDRSEAARIAAANRQRDVRNLRP